MYIRVTVVPNSKKESLLQKAPDRFSATVHAPAERNMANKAVILLVAEHFKISPKTIRIISGHHSPSKILSIDVPEKK